MNESLKTQLQALADAAANEGVSFVGCLASYDANDAHFDTVVSLIENADHHVSEDHILLDINREIAVTWSNLEHAGQLVWEPPNKEEIAQELKLP